MPYKRLSQFSETFSIPQFLLFGTKREFFNSHAIYQQLCCWLKVGKFREGLSNLLFEAQPLRVISQGCDLLCDMRLATLNLDCIVQKVLYTYRRPAEQAAIPLGTNPLKKRLQESWIAAESVSSHSA